MATLETRRALLSDASVMSRLSLELGFDCNEVLMRQRLSRLRDDPEQAVFVASLDGERVVGWVHAEVRKPLWHDPFVAISGLVVHEPQRGLGIGRVLIERVEVWADSRGLTDLRAPIQDHRQRAHEFFAHLGFEANEQVQVWRRALGRVEPEGTPTLVD